MPWFRLIPCLLVSTLAASGSVLFSTDGTATPGFFPSNGYTSTSTVLHAMQFTVGAGQGGVFDELVVPVLSNTAFTGAFNLRSDSAGTLGAILDSAAVTLIGDGVGRLYSATSTNHVTLTAGQTYWIEAASPSGSNSLTWLQANPSVTGRVYSSATGYFNGQPMAGFALLEVPADTGSPEPSTWMLVMTGFMAAYAMKSRSRQG